MKIQQWLGYNIDASQYLLRPGELGILNNLQSRRPGMLIARSGLRKMYGRYDDESIIGIYRRATILGNPTDFLWLQKALVRRDLTNEEILEGVEPYENIWNVRRIQGNQSRIIDTLPYTSNGGPDNFCVTEDRHGRLFIFYGKGIAPRLYRPEDIANSMIELGMSSPKNAPKVLPVGKGYFIEDVDVDYPGGSYNTPPDIEIDGGRPVRAARLKSLLANGKVIGVDIVDGGSQYNKPPKLSVKNLDIGSGFRATGTIGTNAKIEGFATTSQGAITGTGCSEDQTYGTQNGTENQKILVSLANAPTSDVSAKVMQWHGVLSRALYISGGHRNSKRIKLFNVDSIEVGDLLRWQAWNSWNSLAASKVGGTSGWYTVMAVDRVNLTVTINYHTTLNFANHYAYTYEFRRNRLKVESAVGFKVGDRIELSETGAAFDYGTFNSDRLTVQAIDLENGILTLTQFGEVEPHCIQTTSPTPPYWFFLAGNELTASVVFDDVLQVDADYDSERRRFTATIPLENVDAAGVGAAAIAEFSPLPLGFSVDRSDLSSSVALTDTGLNKHYNKILGEGSSSTTRFQTYLYDNYWGGADFDVKNSRENRLYGGLQASGKQFIKGFSGSVNGRPADVYWPDYNFLSVWDNTGIYSQSASQWSRRDVSVDRGIVETGGDPVGYTRLEFQLKPPKTAKTVETVGRTNVSSVYEDGAALPTAVPPTVRLNLRECPDSWVVEGTQSFPTSLKESKANRLPWFSTSSGLRRPIVDLFRQDDGTGELVIPPEVIEVVDPGSGWVKGTVFSFRLYQANAYDQKVDYNVAVSESSKPGGHGRYSASNRYVEFRITANVPDENTPHGPPHTLVSPVEIAVVGDGYASTKTAEFNLLKRNIDDDTSTTFNGQSALFTATEIDTLNGADEGQISGVTILDQGRNYDVAPEIKVRGGGDGFGLVVEPVLDDGRITGARIVDPGRGYNLKPELYTESQSARIRPVMRPALRGKYRCAYRYVDRSEQLVKSTTAYKSSSENTLTLTDVEGVKADMIIEGTDIPFMTRITSVSGNDIDVSAEMPLVPQSGVALWDNEVEDKVRIESSVIFSAKNTYLAHTDTPEGSDEPGWWYSSDNEYALQITNDGNLVLWQRTFQNLRGVREPIPQYVTEKWSSGTSGNPGAFVGLNAAGDFGVWGPPDTTTTPPETYYTAMNANQALWNAAVTNGGSVLLWNNGNLEVISDTVLQDVTIRDLSKPVAYSDLSPIADIDAGPNDKRAHSSKMDWLIENPDPPERADHVELWRTSSDQSLVFYRVEAYGNPTPGSIEIVGEDTLTDEELFDPERANYSAMPIVLPNGGLNAFRFGEARDDMSVCCAFQDRLWYGVSTSGEKANTIFYSEFDEFESCPDLNELAIQQNQKSTDTVTALVPFGSMLLAMQHTHTFSIAYNTDPSIDVTIQMMSHRGALHQRCWDIHENVLYAADESGIYSMSRNGEVQDISLPVRDYFVSELIDFSKRDTFFLQSDPRTHVLRFFCTLKTHVTDTPAFAICYDIQARTWWTESFPNSITSACTGRPADARINTILVGATDGNLYEIDGDADHSNESLTDTFVDEGGAGYPYAPEVTVPNCIGAKCQAVVSEGAVVDVIIQDTGWDSSYGIGILTESGKQLKIHDDKLLQGVEYAPIKLIIGPPDPGGVQAVAYANFSTTPTVRRNATAAVGENFVRIDKIRVGQFEPDYWDNIATEDGIPFRQEGASAKAIRTQPPPVEIGMECIGDFVPLNSFVHSIDRNNIYLKHPDGTDALMIGGLPRSNTANTSTDWLEEGGSPFVVMFKKPASTHIAFRAQTGHMQLANEDNLQRGDTLSDRSVTLVYTPTDGVKEVEIIERFNGQDEMRPNSMRRDRGGVGTFIHRQDSASTVLNTDINASSLARATGVAKAKFASRSNGDMTGTDQHMQVELHGRPARSDGWDRVNFWKPDTTTNPSKPVVIHSMTVNGVVQDAE